VGFYPYLLYYTSGFGVEPLCDNYFASLLAHAHVGQLGIVTHALYKSGCLGFAAFHGQRDYNTTESGANKDMPYGHIRRAIQIQNPAVTE
jgi:hypothetical protein